MDGKQIAPTNSQGRPIVGEERQELDNQSITPSKIEELPASSLAVTATPPMEHDNGQASGVEIVQVAGSPKLPQSPLLNGINAEPTPSLMQPNYNTLPSPGQASNCSSGTDEYNAPAAEESIRL